MRALVAVRAGALYPDGAVELTMARPVSGFGPDNFPLVAPDYVRDVGQLQFVDLIVNRPHQVHNITEVCSLSFRTFGLQPYMVCCKDFPELLISYLSVR